jgi:AcrR family transcriptional regulator
MARKPPQSPSEPESTPDAIPTAVTPPASERERIIAAFMAILAARPFEDIGFAEIARRAEVSLAALRRHFGSKFAILAAYIKDVDRQVLEGIDADMADEPARERLFDVLMRRIEILTPHKSAVRSLMRSVSRDPCLALALNSMAVQSQQWMLTAADIEAAGPKGMVRAQGLAVLFARVLQTFVRDEDTDHARTMAALDKQLSRGQRLAGLFDELCRFTPLRFVPRGWRRRRDDVGDRDFGDEAVPV